MAPCPIFSAVPEFVFVTLLICALHASNAAAVPDSTFPTSDSSLLNRSLQSVGPLGHFASQIPVIGGILRRRFTIWDMVAVAVACCGLLKARGLKKDRDDLTDSNRSFSFRERTDGTGQETDAASTDPGLIKKHSYYKSYKTSIATYPEVRIFLRPHAQADKLPNKPKPLPLLVFVHGLGGSTAQFNNILTSLVNVGPCLGIDLPGCGLSKFEPRDWEAYTHPALVELVSVIIDDVCTSTQSEEVVLIGHSMGCSICASLISERSPYATEVRKKAIGLVAICPKASSTTAKQARAFRKLLSIPTPIFDLWRRWDRRGGTESASVARFVGANAHPETKSLQVKFNAQSKTDVWRRMAWGCIPSEDAQGNLSGGLPGPEVWSGISVPLFLIAGEGDNITKAEELAVIAKALGKGVASTTSDHKSTASISPTTAAKTPESPQIKAELSDDENQDSPSTSVTAVESRQGSYQSQGSTPDTLVMRRSPAFKTSTLPAPAGHALLYDHATYRTLSGLIQSFLASHIDSRLSLGWQLQHLKDANKWDVKNLVKWQGVSPVSEPIAGIFRAMKTLREVDTTHSPTVFLKNWAGKIRAVIDISHETPVYNPQTLDDGGVEYNKFPTVSKIPPTAEEVRDFIILIDRLRSEASDDDRLIGVHCHYGFNRTGFFVCSYLIERLKYSIHQAIDEFQAARPPGIRHEHFLDTLAVRYHRGLRRAPTL